MILIMSHTAKKGDLANFDKPNDYFILKVLIVSTQYLVNLCFRLKIIISKNNNENTTYCASQLLETV